jgi:2-dehydro-3-deoxygluconokinase
MVNPKKIFCFGELLLRLSPALQGEWLRQASLPLYLGGSELNVATALARWHIPVGYCTALPRNYLSEEICQAIMEKNIDVSPVQFLGSRVGIYFLPQGLDLKNAEVIYDRADSSFANLRTGMIDWEKMFNGFSWFHFSAISPAINENLAAVCLEALEVASKMNMTISIDLNHRAKLWQYGKNPIDIMASLVSYCDVVMGNIWSASSLLGMPVPEDIHRAAKKSGYLLQAKETSIAIQEAFPKCTIVAQTFRFDHPGEGIHYYATCWKEEKSYHSREYTCVHVEDKIGTGDCFMAGLIYGLSLDLGAQDTIELATAAAVGKFQERGDATSQDIASVRARMAGG